MLNNKNNVLLQLYRLGLSADEGKVYLALLEQPLSHLEIARKTGVNRTKVYRIADELIKRGLVAENQDETGRQLAANDPANLEIVLKTEEEAVERKKSVLKTALPDLQSLYMLGDLPGEIDFEVNTYEGVDGFKQMLWNELRTEGEILIFGNGTIQDLVNSPRWAEKHREKTLEAGYKIREILNPDGKPNEFTKNKAFMEQSYQRRYVAADILPLAHQLCIYNNTVAIYHWRKNKKVGAEIINKSFADMQRSIFENYWKIAE
ncbi:MAG: helix-turn-helix domain-containing protein [Candidatus Saccharimonadales bacterium]